METPDRLRELVLALERVLEAGADEARVLEVARPAMARLVARDDWLPEAAAKPHPEHYQQYLLHFDLPGGAMKEFVSGHANA